MFLKSTKLIAILFSVLCLFSMCKKDAAKKPVTSNGVYYVNGTLNGQAWNWQVKIDNSDWVVGSSSYLPNYMGDISGGITALVSANQGLQPQLGIEFQTIHKTVDDDALTVFNSFVHTGAWPFATDLNYVIGKKSVVIYYIDKSGKQYSTIGAQSGSSLNVISVTPVNGDMYNSSPGLRIKLTFNCTLFPTDGTGSTLKITNTEATVFLENMIFGY